MSTKSDEKKKTAEATKKANAEKKAAEKAAKDAAKAAAPAKKRGGRPAGVKARKYSASPAGHFQDVLTLIVGRVAKIAARVTKWGADDGALAKGLTDGATNVTTAIASLKLLADAGFKPARADGKGGKTKKPFASGDRVTVNPLGLDLLHKDFPSLTNDHTICVATTFVEGDKAIPLVCKGGTSEAPTSLYIGRVSKKFLTHYEAPAASTTETPAAA